MQVNMKPKQLGVIQIHVYLSWNEETWMPQNNILSFHFWSVKNGVLDENVLWQ